MVIATKIYISPLFSQLLVLTLLIFGTIGFFKVYERYESVGPELLTDPSFKEGLAHWSLSGRGVAQVRQGVVILQVTEQSGGVAVRQDVSQPWRYRLLRLAGELEAKDIRPGRRFWHKGRLVLASFDVGQRMMNVPHLVADLQGTQPWQFYQAVFRVPEQAQTLRAGVQLIGATGTLALRNISLREAREREHYPFYRGLGITIWIVGLLWLSLPYASQLRLNLPHLLVYTAIVGIFAGALVPVEFKMEVESEIGLAFVELMQLVQPSIDAVESAQTISIASRQWGHFLFFALLAVGVHWAYPRAKHGYLLLCLLMLALVSEVLQFFVDGRIPLIRDFFIDAAGLLTGMGLIGIWRGIGWKMRQQQE